MTRWSEDEGFTLTELMVAMAVFGTIMAVVGSAMLTGFSAFRDIMNTSDAIGEAQNAANWTSRLVRYMDVPNEADNPQLALVGATDSSLEFYTFAGMGDVAEAPSKVRLWSERVNLKAPGETRDDWRWQLKGEIAPMKFDEATRRWVLRPDNVSTPGNEGPSTRILMTQPADLQDPADRGPFEVALAQCTWNGSDRVEASRALPWLAPVITDPLAGEPNPCAVTLTFGNPEYPELLVTQNVRLVNLG